MKKTAILLSTYNGEKYLKEQLDSLINQTYQDFTLYIRDDGSSDATVSIIAEYQKEFSKQIVIVDDNKGNIGVEKSFRALVKTAKAEYYFFCDQDDIWQTDKLKVFIKNATNIKKKQPFLIYSDLKYVNNDTGQVIYQSFLNQYRITKNKINQGIFKGVIPGCAMMFNENLKNIFLEVKKNYMLHDGLMLMIASSLGNVYEIKEPLIEYRIHSSNTVGIGRKNNKLTLFKDLAKYFFNTQEYRKTILESYFKQQHSLMKANNTDLLIHKELYDEKSINKLRFVKRKKWYAKHFLPLEIYGFFEGTLRIITF